MPLRITLQEEASSPILIYNHPSGGSTPSPQELACTNWLLKATQWIGIPLSNRLIIASSGYASLTR
ncbi:JAB domain-containing protein [Pajaroellobacter abortibovis]|uniref:JAB domain-containing protein n=1 Tax=Pajaroellobacter abortibovis TaxID=1882918 RepID=UPI0009F8FB31